MTQLAAGVTKSANTLADGRSIFYYDTANQVRNAVDRRPSEAQSPIGELRHNALLDDWVAVAAHRQTRTFMPPKELCPLCPTAPDADLALTEIPEADYEVVVFDNRFPSLTRPTLGFTLPSFQGLQDQEVEAAGKCEVVCFSSNHAGHFRTLSEAQVRVVLEAWKDRTSALFALPDVVQVFCFENRGVEIGVTLSHPHGQIYGYSYLPATTKQMLRAAVAYQQQTGRILLEDILQRELTDGRRIISQNEDWVAYVPFAARYPYEIHLAPRRSVGRLTDLNESASSSFGSIYLEVLRRLDGVFSVDMPYIAAWHQSPKADGADALRLHLQITSIRRSPDKIKFLAGSESAMGAFISDVTPEQAALQLQAVEL